jgi:DNA primase
MDTLIETIKARIDVVDEIGQTIVLHRSGKSLKGLCPFHSERTPSFYVFPSTQTWRCFGCNEGGDVFSFVQKQQGFDFRETLHYLAEKAGVQLEERTGAEAEAEREQHARRERLRKLNDDALLWFHQMLLHSREANEARAYVQSRGISTETVIAFGLGYAPDSWNALSSYLLSKGYSERELVAGGLARVRNENNEALGEAGTSSTNAGEGTGDDEQGSVPGGIRDYFRNRLLFPIRDIRGRVIGFGGRALGDGKPKYLNSPQTVLFEKNTVLYAIDKARDAIKQAHQVVIVEGYVDAVIAHQYGTTQTVACIGSAITERHIQQLKTLTKQVTLALDPDAAGSAATEHGIQEAMKGFDRTVVPVLTVGSGSSKSGQDGCVKNRQGARGIVMLEERVDAEINIMRLPDGEDPDEVIRRDYSTWLYAVEHPLSLIDYYFETKTEHLDLREPNGKAEAAKQLLPVIGTISSRIKRDIYLRKLAAMVGVEERVLHEELQRTMRGQQGVRVAFTEPMGGSKGRRGSEKSEERQAQGDGVGQEYQGNVGEEKNVTNSVASIVSIDKSKVDKIQWEDYLIGLLLHYPGLNEHICRIIYDNDFTGTETRELYRILNSSGSRSSSPAYQSVEQLMQMVPGVLQGAIVRANKCVESRTSTEEAGLVKEAVQCATRLKRTRLVQQNTELQYLLREAVDSGDSAGVRQLQHRLREIHQQVRTIDTAIHLQG